MFQINTCALKDGTVLVSYIHPLTKRRTRKTFALATEAAEYKRKIESKFNGLHLQNYRDMTLEDLMILFLNERPATPFFKMKMHVIDFAETFGHLKVREMAPHLFRAWFDQVQ